MKKKPAPDIDSGWAWLVLGVVYLGIIIISTSLYMSGVLYVALLEHFNAGEAKTSLVGAVNTGLLCLLGPLASVVMVTFSCRVCMLLGAAIASISYVVSAYVHSIDMLILTHGVIGGIGNALSCTTFVVVLGYYFEQRRNIVIAISQAALGVGFFLASPVALATLNTFGLHGTFVVLGSAYAQICVIAMICKPSSIEQRIMGKNKPNYELEIVKIEEIKPEDETKLQLLEKGKNEQRPKLVLDKRISDRINGLKPIEYKNGIGLHHSIEIIYEMNGHLKVDRPIVNGCNGMKAHELPKVTTSCLDIPRTGKPNGMINAGVFWSNGHLSNMAASNGFLQELFPIQPTEETYAQAASNTLWIWRLVNGMCNIHLFKNLPFMMFLLSTMTWNFTLSMCAMHLPNYMVLKGSSDFEVAAIMTCFSFSNFAGRFIGALTVERGGLDSLTLHVGMLGVAGIVTLFFPLYAGSSYQHNGRVIMKSCESYAVSLYMHRTCFFWGFVRLSPMLAEVGVYVFAAAVGLYTGGPNSIMTPISLQMVGMEYLSSAHGLERFFCGLGYFAGPPVAGYLFSISGSYESSFLCAGGVVLAGSVVALVAAVKRKPITIPVEDNGSALEDNDSALEDSRSSVGDSVRVEKDSNDIS